MKRKAELRERPAASRGRGHTGQGEGVNKDIKPGKAILRPPRKDVTRRLSVVNGGNARPRSSGNRFKRMRGASNPPGVSITDGVQRMPNLWKIERTTAFHAR